MCQVCSHKKQSTIGSKIRTPTDADSRCAFVIGMDIVGVVEAVGHGVAGFRQGDVVVATNGASPIGGLAEYMVR